MDPVVFVLLAAALAFAKRANDGRRNLSGQPMGPNSESAERAVGVALYEVMRRTGRPISEMAVWYNGSEERDSVAAFHDCNWSDPRYGDDPPGSVRPLIYIPPPPGWVAGSRVVVHVGGVSHEVLIDPAGRIGCYRMLNG